MFGNLTIVLSIPNIDKHRLQVCSIDNIDISWTYLQHLQASPDNNSVQAASSPRVAPVSCHRQPQLSLIEDELRTLPRTLFRDVNINVNTSGECINIDSSRLELDTKVAEDYAKFYNHGECPY